MPQYRIAVAAVACAIASILSACGGGGGGGKSPPTAASFTVSGTISGLAGSGLVLQNNAGNNLAVAQNGSFTFASALMSGSSYNVSVLTQPSAPTQACTVVNGSGTIAANVTNVTVTCVTGAFTVGGTISGLATDATGLVLINNGGDNRVINANGAFTFQTPVASGTSYDIRVLSQPYDPYQSCAVENGSGVVTNAGVTAPSITCTTLVPKFASSIDFEAATYSQYAIDASTGQLRARGFVSVGANPVDVGAYGFDAKVSFVLSRATGALHSFARDSATGKMSEGTNSPQLTGAVPSPGANPPTGAVTLTVHPKLPFVYVANGGGTSTIAGFRFDPANAALTPIPGTPFAAGDRPIRLLIDSSGRTAYAANRDSENITAYTIDQTTGALTPLGAAVPAGASGLLQPAIHPFGKFLYLPNSSGSISGYTIAPTGVLTAIANSPFNILANLTAPISFHPSGKYLFVKSLPPANAQGAVVAVAIDQVTGALSAIGSPLTVGVNPTTLWAESSGRYLFVANRGPAPQTFQTAGSISVLRINAANGELTALAGVEGLTPPPYSVSLDWSGKYLYSASAEGNLVRAYSFDTATGAVTALQHGADAFVRGAPLTLLPIPSATAEPAKFRSKFGYVPNFASNTITAFATNSSTGVLAAGSGVGPSSDISGITAIALTPHSTRLLAVNSGNVQSARSFPINPMTGALGTTSAAAAAGTSPSAIVVEQSGRFAYAADGGASQINAFTIDPANGNVTALASFPSEAGPLALAMHPSGRYLYYVTATHLGVRRVDTQNGALNAAFAEVTGGINTAVAIHPTGHFAYVTRMGNPGQVNVYRIRSSGAQVGQFAASTPVSSGGNDAVSVAIHPSGRFLYVANRASNNVAAFAVNPTTGELSGIGTPVAFNNPTVSVRVDYSGGFLYVVDTTPQVRTFAINTTTGALVAVAPTGLSTGTSPRELVLTEDIE